MGLSMRWLWSGVGFLSHISGSKCRRHTSGERTGAVGMVGTTGWGLAQTFSAAYDP